MSVKTDISKYIGNKYGRLTIIKEGTTCGRHFLVVAKCECGKLKEYRLASIINSLTRSCGCLRTDSNLTGNNRRTHGLVSHPLHGVWADMRKRCYNEDCKYFDKYGGRGVVVCEEWKDNFKAFYDWAISNGWQKGLHLDKDKLSPDRSGKMYSPEFCCFITKNENMQYRTDSIVLQFNGIEKCLAEWCRIFNLNYRLINSRIKRGWETKRAFETPVLLKYINIKK